MIEKKEDVLAINLDFNEASVLEGSLSLACNLVQPQNTEPYAMLLPTSPDITASVLAESYQFLDVAISRVQDDIQKSFANIFEVLKSREKQLLRQVDVLHNQQIALLQSSHSPQTKNNNELGPGIPQVMVNLDKENHLIENILSFGKVCLNSGNMVAIEGSTTPYSIPYKVEDYQDADHDHVCLYKPLSNTTTPQQEVIKFGFLPKLVLLNSTTVDDGNEDSYNDEISRIESPELESEDNSESENLNKKDQPQVQQWLEQIKVETETEPSIGEVEKNFAIISHSQSTSNNSFD